MKERIRELANGQVEGNCPALTITPAQVERSLKTDGIYKSTFLVETTNGVAVKGIIYSSHNRVSLARQTFYGRSNEIVYEVNTNALPGQSLIEGGFTLVTNAGVYKIPFSFVIEENGYGSNQLLLHSMADFSTLLQQEPETAYRLFRSKTFVHLPIFRSMEQVALYQTLNCDPNVERCVEEFLACVEEKPSLVFSIVGDTGKNHNELEEDITGEITLCKNTWGWGELQVHCDADFISLSDTHIMAKQFENDRYVVTYTVFADLLAVGTNVAEVIFSTSKGDLIYRICISQKEKTRFLPEKTMLRKRTSVRLTTLYMEYRQLNCLQESQKKIRKKFAELEQCIEQLRQQQPEEVTYSLMLIYIHLLKKRPEDADLLLDQVRETVVQERLTNVRNYCFYLYLRACFTEQKEQMDTAAALINKYYTEGNQDPILLFLLMEADASLKSNKSLVLLRLKELYKNGCRSPLLYLTACEFYREQPDLLRVLNAFELQTVYYGARKGLLSEEMAAQIARAASHELQYKPFTCRLLTFLCKKYPTDAMMEMLCSYLIRSGCVQRRFFTWYEQAVERRLNIVSLYENYMYSFPEDSCKPIPQEVLLYFTYSNHKKDDIQEKLYENVLVYYAPDTQVYREYSHMMEEYALSKLLEGRISRKLVPLYRHLVLQELIDERLARVLPNLLMAHEFTCANTNMKCMVLRYPELNYEDVYPLEKGVCCAPVFSDNCMVFFMDEKECRYCDIPYRKERLFDDADLLKRCEEVYPAFFMFRLGHCRDIINNDEQGEKEELLLKEMLHVAELHPLFRTKIISKLLDYNLQREELDRSLLSELDLSSIPYKDRKKALECLIRAGSYETVYQYIKFFGISGIKNESLLLLVQNLIKSPSAGNDGHLIYLCLYLFTKDIYTPATLVYLTTYYDGPSDMMYRVLAADQENQQSCLDLPERILAQKLFSGDWDKLDEVYAVYAKECKVHELMERAYYVVCSYRYFVLNEPQPEKMFACLEEYCMQQERPYEQIDICNIALLYYYSRCEHLLEEQIDYCEILLGRLCKKGLMFGFYGKLWTKVSCPAELNGKFLLEHRTKNAKRVYLRSKFVGEDEETVQSMQEMYAGIFVSQIILFADETWKYSIQEETEDGLVTVVEEEVMANDMSFVRQGSVFEMINRLGKHLAQGQEKRLEETMVTREAQREIVKRLFEVM